VEIRSKVDDQKKWLQININNLQKAVANVEDFVDQNNSLASANEKFQEKRDGVDLNGMYYNILSEYNIKVKKDDKDNFNEVVALIQQLQTIIANVEGQQDSNQETFKKQLNDLIPQLNTEISTLHEASLNEAFLSGESNMFDMSRQLDELEGKLTDLDGLSQKYNNWQEVLQMNPTSFENLDKAREDISLRCLMWRSLQQWEDKTDNWTKT
jgi:PleD family two-component response regulator